MKCPGTFNIDFKLPLATVTVVLLIPLISSGDQHKLTGTQPPVATRSQSSTDLFTTEQASIYKTAKSLLLQFLPLLSRRHDGDSIFSSAPPTPGLVAQPTILLHQAKSDRVHVLLSIMMFIKTHREGGWIPCFQIPCRSDFPICNYATRSFDLSLATVFWSAIDANDS